MVFTLLATLGFRDNPHWEEFVMPLACMLFLVVLFWYLTVRICLDLTSRVWREKVNAEKAGRAAAERANQAKTEFLANMSHEIRAPLNAIIHFTELAPKAFPDSESQQHLGAVRTSAQWLIHIVNDVLQFSRSEAGSLRLENEAFSVEECVGAALHMIRGEAEARRLVLRSKIDAEIPAQLRGDFTRLLQVIFNLVENAVRCTTKGGVVVSAELAGRAGLEMTLRFSVQDTGVGVSDQQLKDFFKPLTHSSAFDPHAGQGSKGWMTSAFGLAICEKIVGMMGGDMEVRSRLGAGTMIRFTAKFETLPERHFAAPVVNTEERATCSAARPLAILLADENDISRRLTKVLLESAGHSVCEASKAAEVLPLFSQGAFDLVLLDLDMGPPDGMTVAQSLRPAEGNGFHTPIYALIHSAATADREECRAAGIQGFLMKPVEIDAVLNIVAAIALRPLPARAASLHLMRSPEQGGVSFSAPAV